ncbi:MAG TPA: hypothetical protein VG603_02690, partial [Chitinophagales bacterium]|nr:hypothetical protein [Chitinophagales bacterium]
EGMSKEIVDWNKNHPDDPALWTDGMFGGMPAVQISLIFSGNLVSKIYHIIGLIFPAASSYMFMMFLGFYILLLCLDVDPWLSLGGAIAYGLGSFTIISIEAGHNTKIQALTMMAPVLGGVVLAYRKNILLGAALTALFFAVELDANHFQIVYYTALVLGITGIYFFIESIIQKKLVHFTKATCALIVAAILALLPNIGNFWSTQEYAKETMRGGSSELTQKKQVTNGGLDYDYATRWSEGSLFYKKYVLQNNNTGEVKVFGPGETDEVNILYDSLNKKSPGVYTLKTEHNFDGEFLSVLIPNIKGGVSGGELDENSDTYKEMINKGVPENTAEHYIKQMPLYWGNQPFTSGPVYFGAAIIFLSLFSLLIIRSHIKWVLLALTVFSFLLSFGHNTPFFGWLFNVLPMFNKFRTPAMALVIGQMAVPVLALLGLNEVLKGEIKQDELLKKLQIAGGITAAVVILFGLLGGMFVNFTADADKQYYDSGNGWLIDAIKKDRASLLHMDALRSLFFIAAAFGLLWFYIKKTLSRTVLAGAMAVLFLLDGWMVAKRYLNNDNFVETSKYQSSHTPTQADLDILKDPDPHFRVFNTTRDPFNDAMTSYYHNSIGGYHPAKLIRYQDLIERQISKYNMAVLDMLNTKYFEVEDRKTKEPIAQRNPGACGNVWFVHEIKWVDNADQEIDALTNFQPLLTAVVDKRYKSQVPDNAIGSDSAGAIRLLEYTPNHLKYASNSTTSQVAVFSEIYYDGGTEGWQAYIDGKPVEHFRADYVLRAMVVPAGTHTIEFKFEPRSVVLGNKIDYAGSFLLFLFVFGILGFAGYNKYKEVEAEPTPQPKPVAAPEKTKPGKKK